MPELHATPADEPEENDNHVDGRWPCKVPECGAPVEANPRLYLSLAEDGTWYIDGVGDECALVTCSAVEHDQDSEILSKSLTTFLEQQFPGGTWQGSAPQRKGNDDA